jgi:6-phosphogluconolactonase
VNNFELISFAAADELARAAADRWLDEIESANRAGKRHCVALSGGRIARKFFAAVAEQDQAGAVSFAGVHFCWADERCVPPDDPESNFRLANELLFTPLKISESQIHRIHGELPPAVAAAQAAAEISKIAPLNKSGQPVLDLIFLGMGEDGHVASLFPGEPEKVILNTAVYRAVKNSPKPPPNRITLGYATIAAARRVWVLVSGADKELALRQSLCADGRTPLARVTQFRTLTRVFSDLRPV